MIHKLNDKYEDAILALQEELVDIYMAERNVDDDLGRYSTVVTQFLGDMFNLEAEINEAYFTEKTFNELLELNHSYFRDIQGDAYLTSYANPDVTAEKFGKEVGQVMASIYFGIRGCVAFAFEGRKVSMMWAGSLFVEAYQVLSLNRDQLVDNHEVYELLIQLLKKHVTEDMSDKLNIGLYRRFDQKFNIYNKIASLPYDSRNIFRYGMYIGENEIQLQKYFQETEEEKLQKIADTYTEAFIRGFERNSVSLEGKKTVNVGYHIGFEPIIGRAYKNLEAYGLTPVVHYEVAGSLPTS